MSNNTNQVSYSCRIAESQPMRKALPLLNSGGCSLCTSSLCTVFFIRCGTRACTTPSRNQYKYAVVVILHESCGQGTELFAEADNLDQGQLVAILVKPVDLMAKAFCATIRRQRPSVPQTFTTIQPRMESHSHESTGG